MTMVTAAALGEFSKSTKAAFMIMVPAAAFLMGAGAAIVLGNVHKIARFHTRGTICQPIKATKLTPITLYNATNQPLNDSTWCG